MVNAKMNFSIRPIIESDQPWVFKISQERWGSNRVVSKGKVHEVNSLPGFLAIHSDQMLGLLAYSISNDELEIVSLVSLEENIGIGTALISTAREYAQQAGYHRMWLITTNDNTPALHFYQKRGFHLVAVHRNALELSRNFKPEIPHIGLDGIPLRDEIELELLLTV
jgi:RimJ/RimL family protein N-acetyltransferase